MPDTNTLVLHRGGLLFELHTRRVVLNMDGVHISVGYYWSYYLALFNKQREMIIAFIAFVSSAVFEAVMDYLQFYYIGMDHFWNPRLSWINKWKFQQVGKTERFFLSSTVLVFLTDGWHLMKWCRNRCIDMGIFELLCDTMTVWQALGVAIVIRITIGLIFELMLRVLK